MEGIINYNLKLQSTDIKIELSVLQKEQLEFISIELACQNEEDAIEKVGLYRTGDEVYLAYKDDINKKAKSFLISSTPLSDSSLPIDTFLVDTEAKAPYQPFYITAA